MGAFYFGAEEGGGSTFQFTSNLAKAVMLAETVSVPEHVTGQENSYAEAGKEKITFSFTSTLLCLLISNLVI